MNNKIPLAIGLKPLLERRAAFPVRSVQSMDVKRLEAAAYWAFGALVGVVPAGILLATWIGLPTYFVVSIVLTGWFSMAALYFLSGGQAARSDDQVFEGRVATVSTGWTIFFVLGPFVIVAPTISHFFIR